MTDLTLDEYRGISQRELGQKLQAEARMMFNPESLEKDMAKAANDIYPVTQHKHQWTALISRYWDRITTSICFKKTLKVRLD